MDNSKRDQIFINVCQLIANNLHNLHPDAIDGGVFVRLARNPETNSLQLTSLNVYRSGNSTDSTITQSWQITDRQIYQGFSDLWLASDRSWFNAMFCIKLTTGQITSKFIPKAEQIVPWIYQDPTEPSAAPMFDYLTIKRPYLDTIKQLTQQRQQ